MGGVVPSLVGRRLGGYELVEELGSGSMGVVYRAVRLSNGRPVAVKVLSPELAASPEFVRRFEREARATERLDHPGIVKAFDIGRQEELYYFAMELLSGRSLEQQLFDRMRLEPTEVAALGIQIAEALAHAHARGLLHRDIKPGNLMTDRDGRWLITDFGIALAEAETRLTRTGQSLGSPNYVAPEIIRGAPADGRSDLYSLGIVLFQALTGELPYRGRTAFAVIEQHLKGPVAHARGVDRALPEELDRIVARLMAKDPDERYAGGSEVAADLLALAGSEMAAPDACETGPIARETVGLPSPTHGRGLRLLWVGLAALIAVYLASRAACG